MIEMIWYDPGKQKEIYVHGDLATKEFTVSARSLDLPYTEDGYSEAEIDFDGKNPIDFFKDQIVKYGYQFIGFC